MDRPQLGAEGARPGPADGHHAHGVPPSLRGAGLPAALLDMRRITNYWRARRGWPSSAILTTRRRGFIKKYSPYHNIDPGRRYPPVLITSSTRDDRCTLAMHAR